MSLIEQIKKLREETGISISECKKAIEEANGNFDRAKEILKQSGKFVAQKKAERKTRSGIIDSYIHPGRKIGVMIELFCETDFVANSEDFKKLAHELCLQAAAISPQEAPFLEQNWIRDERKKIKDLIDEYIAKFGENIVVGNIFRTQI